MMTLKNSQEPLDLTSFIEQKVGHFDDAWILNFLSDKKLYGRFNPTDKELEDLRASYAPETFSAPNLRLLKPLQTSEKEDSKEQIEKNFRDMVYRLRKHFQEYRGGSKFLDSIIIQGEDRGWYKLSKRQIYSALKTFEPDLEVSKGFHLAMEPRPPQSTGDFDKKIPIQKVPSKFKEVKAFFLNYKGGSTFLDSIRSQIIQKGFQALSDKQLLAVKRIIHRGEFSR